MELPPLSLPPAHPAVGAGAAAQAPGNTATTDAAALLAPGFAELLAAGLALPETAGNADPAGSAATPDVTLVDPEIALPAPAAPGAPDPTLALVLAAITLPGAGPVPAAGSAGDNASAPRTQATGIEAMGSLPAAAPAERAIASVPPLQLAAHETDAGAAAPALSADAITDLAVSPSHAQAAHARMAQPAPVHAPAVASEVRAPIGAADWDAQLGRTVAWMAGERHQVAEVRLNPPDLGPLEIVLRLSGDDGGQASVTFASPHADVRAALENALPRLREMLAAAGISLGQADVNAESFRDARGAGHPGTGNSDAPGAAGAASATTRAAVRAGAGLVDIFA